MSYVHVSVCHMTDVFVHPMYYNIAEARGQILNDEKFP